MLDFGLAKAFAGDESDVNLSQSPTLSAAATQQGVILGTAAYMSPEQARGETADKRADVWAFGCVLFEMLTGRGTFDGRTVSDVLAGVLRADPEWNSLPANLHPRLRLLLERCLEKDAGNRYHDIADVRVDVQQVLADPNGVTLRPVADVVQAAPQSKMPWIAATAMMAVITGLAVWSLTASAPNEAAAVSRFTIDMPSEAPVVTNYGWRAVTISPDGSRIAYTSNAGGTRRIYVRPLDQLEATVLRGTEDNGTAPFFSPDGESIGFTGEDGRTLKRVSAFGGPPVTIATFNAQPYGMEWTSDDTILFSFDFGRPGLFQIPAVGGEVDQLTTVDEEANEQQHERATLLPDRDTVLFTIVYASEEPRLARLSLRSREVTRLPITGSDPIYSPTGHIVYVVSDGTVRAVGFDLDRLELTSTNPTPVLENVNSGFAGTTGNFGLAANGSLVYLTGDPQAAFLTLVWVDREGREEEVPIQTGSYLNPRISPDGSRVALDDRNEGWDTWIWDFTSETRTHLTVGERGGLYPTWTPNGERIAYYNRAGDIDWKAANNTGSPERLAESPGDQGSDGVHPQFFTPTGAELVFQEQDNPETGHNLGMIAVEDAAEPIWLLREPFNERNAELSPNGRWLAYESDESGQYEIYVRPFPNVDDDRVLVSNASGVEPLWSRDGRELFYIVTAGAGGVPMLMVVTLEEVGTDLTVDARRPLIAWPYRANVGNLRFGRNYDVSLDGRRFLAIKDEAIAGDSAAPSSQIIVVLNWLEELKERVPLP